MVSLLFENGHSEKFNVEIVTENCREFFTAHFPNSLALTSLSRKGTILPNVHFFNGG